MKTHTCVSISPHLLPLARLKGINVSAVLESALEALLSQDQVKNEHYEKLSREVERLQKEIRRLSNELIPLVAKKAALEEKLKRESDEKTKEKFKDYDALMAAGVLEREGL